MPRRRPVEPIVRLNLQEPTFKLVISDNVEGPDLADLNRLSPIRCRLSHLVTYPAGLSDSRREKPAEFLVGHLFLRESEGARIADLLRSPADQSERGSR